MTRPAAHGAAADRSPDGGPTPAPAPAAPAPVPAAPAGPAPAPPLSVSRTGASETTPDGIPRLLRLPDQRLVAGVAAGVARHLRVSVGAVRAVFVVLGLLAGAGVVGYALLWIFVPQVSALGGGDTVRRSSARERRQAMGIAGIGVAAGIVMLALGADEWIGALAGPLAIVAIGAAFLWREADDAQRRRWRRTAAGWARPRTWWRVIAGVVLVVGGLAVFAVAQVDVASARSAVIAVVLTLVGVAVIAVPWLAKLLRDLTDERRERIREAEKAEVAAHLHDSVLQTLALIQRRPGDPREVQRLARAQERDLRAWLYGPGGYAWDGAVPAAVDRAPTASGPAPAPAAPTNAPAPPAPAATCAAALTRAAAEVEDTYSIEVSPVVVGDLPLTEPTSALIAAAREAMVNAAKHAGVDVVSVYAEFESSRASVFVRDRGRGFDPSAIPADRRGVVESIRGRMERYGGRAEVRTSPGAGTEWVLTAELAGADGG